MKYSLVSAVILTIAAGTANAQMAFETGNIDFSYYDYPSLPGVSIYISSGRGAYSIGQMGMQLDASVLIKADTLRAINEYSAGLHLYKPLANGSKIGAYADVDMIFSFFPFPRTGYVYNVGAEGLASFGALDVEAAIGFTSITPASASFWTADIDAYYTISPAIELNAGAFLFLINGSTGIYNIGATYTLPNIPLSIGATYLTRGGSSAYSINASFAFGPKPEQRLFNTRIFPLYGGF